MPRRRAFDALILIAAVAAGAWLRFSGLGVPSLWLDEVLYFDFATHDLHAPLWRWLAGFEAGDGPLYLASELAGRFLPAPELSARIAPALFGVAAIVVAYFAGAFAAPAAASDPPSVSRHPLARSRYVFPLLLAFSPLHVYYSREGRSYAVSLLLATALLLLLLRGRRPGVVILLLLAVTYTAPSNVPLLGAAAMAALFAYRGRTRWLVSGSAIACIGLVPLIYRGGAGHVEDFGFPAITARSLRSILESFSAAAIDTSHPHRVAWLFLALAITGAIAAGWRERGIVLSLSILPIVLALLALWRLNHFFAIRYVACALPPFLLLVAMGVSALATLARGAAVPVALAISLLLVHDGFEAARREPFQKLDWRGIAASIGEHSRPGDQVVATNDWTTLTLGFYLRQAGSPVRILNAGGKREMALMFLSQHPQGWIASAGPSEAPGMGELACRFPLVEALPLENFHLHYVTGVDHLLSTRSTGAEPRALLASYGGTIDLSFGAGDGALLDGHWGSPEPEDGRFARWVLGPEAGIALPLPAPADREIVFDVAPVTAARPQLAVVHLNDQLLAVVPMKGGRHSYTVEAPRAFWHDGENRLALTFDHATSPASVDPKSTDERQLAARFYRFTVLAHGQSLPPLPPPDRLHHIHLGEISAAAYEDRALPLRRGGRDATRVAAQRLFAARLGFDPDRTVPRLQSDELRPAHLAMAFADDSLCLDDEEFLRQAWLGLLGRAIAPRELVIYRRKLEAGTTTRRDVVRNIANSEVLDALSGPR